MTTKNTVQKKETVRIHWSLSDITERKANVIVERRKRKCA